MSDIGSKIGVEVAALAYGGSSVGRIVSGPEDLIGKKAFVPWVVPGELVEGVVVADGKRFVTAEASDVVRRSAFRVVPPCPLFTRCGGCQFQHIEGREQRRLRVEMVEQTLRVQAKVVPLEGVALLGESLPYYHYRRRIGLHVTEGGSIGFYKAGTGEVVDVPYCFLASEPLNNALLEVRPLLQAHSAECGGAMLEERGGEVFVVLKARERVRISEAFAEGARSRFPNVEILQGKESRYRQLNFEELGDPSLYPAGHFSQVNDAGNELLVEAVLANITGRKVTELYAGSGNFSFPLARAGKEVRAVELDKSLVALGRRDAEAQGLPVLFFEASCESFVRRHPLDESVVLDPPRSGAKYLIPAFRRSGTREIVYVSCNLPSLSRDLAALLADGYIAVKVYVVDMFPQTFHTETVTILRSEH